MEAKTMFFRTGDTTLCSGHGWVGLAHRLACADEGEEG